MLHLLTLTVFTFLTSPAASAAPANCTDSLSAQAHLAAAQAQFTCPNPDGLKQAVYCDPTSGGKILWVTCTEDDLTINGPADTPNSIKYPKKRGTFAELVQGEEFKYAWQQANGYDRYVPSTIAWETDYKFANGGKSVTITTTMSTRDYSESLPFKPLAPTSYSAVLCSPQAN